MAGAEQNNGVVDRSRGGGEENYLLANDNERICGGASLESHVYGAMHMLIMHATEGGERERENKCCL